MELKNPRPLGEKKTSESSITDQFLQIAKEKDLKKRSTTKIPLPTFKLFTRKEKKTENIQDTKPLNSNTPNVKTEKKNLSSLIQNLKNISFQNIKIYISTHKQQVINISLLCIPLLILLVLIIVIVSYTRAEPYRVAKEFMQKIEDRDISTAYELTSDAYKAVTTEKEFKDVVNRLNTVDISNRKIKNKRIDNEKEMGQYAYIRYKVSGSYLDLVVYNDTLDWRVHSIELTAIK